MDTQGEIERVAPVSRWLAPGKLPRKDAHIQRSIRHIKSALIEAVIAKRGEVTTLDAITISSIIRHELYAKLAVRWLTVNNDTLAAKDKLCFMAAVSSATEMRDKALARLKLDQDKTIKIVDQVFESRIATKALAKSTTTIHPVADPLAVTDAEVTSA